MNVWLKIAQMKYKKVLRFHEACLLYARDALKNSDYRSGVEGCLCKEHAENAQARSQTTSPRADDATSLVHEAHSYGSGRSGSVSQACPAPLPSASRRQKDGRGGLGQSSSWRLLDLLLRANVVRVTARLLAAVGRPSRQARVALAADHLVAVVLLGQQHDRGLHHLRARSSLPPFRRFTQCLAVPCVFPCSSEYGKIFL